MAKKKALYIFLFVGFSLSIPNSAFARDREIKIGLASNFSLINLTNTSPYGDYFRNGIHLAVEENLPRLKKKGIRIVLKEYDIGTSPSQIIDGVKKMSESPIIAVIGYSLSSDALIAAPYHQHYKVPMITSASATRLASFGSYVHMGVFTNKTEGRDLADVARDKLKAKKAALIVAEDCAYCVDLANAFAEAFTRDPGYTVHTTRILGSYTSDFSKILSELKKIDFDVVVVPNLQLLSAAIVSATFNAGIQKPFLGGDGWSANGREFYLLMKSQNIYPGIKQSNGKYIEGFSLSPWHPKLPNIKSKNFIKAYQTSFQRDPTITAVLAYDSMSLLIEALLKTKNYSRPEMETELQQLREFEGATGKTFFSKSAGPQKQMNLLTFGKDQFDYVEKRTSH